MKSSRVPMVITMLLCLAFVPVMAESAAASQVEKVLDGKFCYPTLTADKQSLLLVKVTSSGTTNSGTVYKYSPQNNSLALLAENVGSWEENAVFAVFLWSPDKKKILFPMEAKKNKQDKLQYDTWLLDLDSGKRILLASGTYPIMWYPDMKRVVVSRQQDSSYHIQLYIVDLNTKKMTPAISYPDFMDYGFYWAGSKLFITEGSGRGELLYEGNPNTLKYDSSPIKGAVRGNPASPSGKKILYIKGLLLAGEYGIPTIRNVSTRQEQKLPFKKSHTQGDFRHAWISDNELVLLEIGKEDYTLHRITLSPFSTSKICTSNSCPWGSGDIRLVYVPGAKQLFIIPGYSDDGLFRVKL